MHYLITGGTGFIGRHLLAALVDRSDKATLYVRNTSAAHSLFDSFIEQGLVSLVTGFDEVSDSVDGVINLAGEPIVDKRWTQKRKGLLRASRIDTTRKLVEWIASREQKPAVLVSGSAIGYYGNYPEDIDLDEQALPRYCFASDLCEDWEQAALKAEDAAVRVVRVRTGVVLHKKFGALKKLWLPFSLGLGGRVGSGKQWFSWIHIEDMVNLLLFACDNRSLVGAINATAPSPVTYQTFADTLAQTLGRPAWLDMPAAAMQLLLGEVSSLLLEGQKVVPSRLLQAGFSFRYPELPKALQAIKEEKHL